MLSILLLAGVIAMAAGQSVDSTMVAKETGSKIVEAVVDRLSLACIFDNDKQMLRRMARATTNDGADLVTTGDYNGGIWKISQADHLLVKTQFLFFQPILDATEVDISKAVYADYEKPLYSGIAAYLKLMSETGGVIPWKCSDQATVWVDDYAPTLVTAATADYTAACGAQAACETPKADIIIVMDESGSVGAGNFDLVKAFVNDIVGSFDVSADGVRIGLIKYSTQATIVSVLGTETSTAAVQGVVQRISYGQGGTRTDRALLEMHEMFKADGRGSSGIPQIAIVITDGASNDAAALRSAMNTIQNEPYTIFAVGITSGANSDELELIGSDPDCLHVYIIENFADIADFVSQITELTCKAPAELPAIGEVSGELGDGDVLFFRLKVKKTGNGVTIKLKMNSGGSKMYLSWRVRNPSDVVYDYIQQITFNHKEGGWVFIPWPTYLDSSVVETYLYGALVGESGGLGVGNRYVMEYTEGQFSGGVRQSASLVLVLVTACVYGMW